MLRGILPKHVCLHTTWKPHAQKDQISVLDPLQLELQVVVTSMWMLGINPGSSERAVMLLTFEPSLLKMHIVAMSYNSARTPFRILFGELVWGCRVLAAPSRPGQFPASTSRSSQCEVTQAASRYPTSSAGLHNDLNTYSMCTHSFTF